MKQQGFEACFAVDVHDKINEMVSWATASTSPAS